MTTEERQRLAVELGAAIVAARVGAAAGRPNAAEGRDAAEYLRLIVDELRRCLGVAERPGGAS
jgi:hypothetical protein